MSHADCDTARVRWAMFVVIAVAFPFAAWAQPSETRSIADIIRIIPPSDTCLTQPMLVAQVEAWLGAVDTQVPISIEVDLTSSDSPVIVRIHRDGDSAVKSFDVLPAECASRLRAVSLAIALAIDYTAVERVARQGRERAPERARAMPELLLGARYRDEAIPDPVAPPAATPLPELPAQTARSSQAAAARTFALEASGAALANVLPEFAWGATVSAQSSVAPSWRIRAGALVTQEIETDLGPGLVDARLAAASAGACRQLWRGSIAGCLDVAVGAAHASGQGFSSTRTTWRLWSAVLPGVELRIPLTAHARIAGSTSLAISWARPRVHVVAGDDDDELASRVWPAVGVMTTLGLQLSL